MASNPIAMASSCYYVSSSFLLVRPGATSSFLLRWFVVMPLFDSERLSASAKSAPKGLGTDQISRPDLGFGGVSPQIRRHSSAISFRIEVK